MPKNLSAAVGLRSCILLRSVVIERGKRAKSKARGKCAANGRRCASCWTQGFRPGLACVAPTPFRVREETAGVAEVAGEDSREIFGGTAEVVEGCRGASQFLAAAVL